MVIFFSSPTDKYKCWMIKFNDTVYNLYVQKFLNPPKAFKAYDLLQAL